LWAGTLAFVTRRVAILLAVVGACVTLLLAAATAGIVLVTGHDSGESSAARVSSTCDGASFDVTLATGPGESADLVTAQVVVFDEAGRQWRVRWLGGYALPRVVYASGVDVGHSFGEVGDLDDGTDREIQVRPVGGDSWCGVTATIG
jgi:hypothetical protein